MLLHAGHENAESFDGINTADAEEKLGADDDDSFSPSQRHSRPSQAQSRGLCLLLDDSCHASGGAAPGQEGNLNV